MHLSLTRWRLLLLAAFVLLAGAMGGGDAVARAGVAQITGECPDQDSCNQRLTAPSQPALIQVALRIDGKALTGSGGGFAALPGDNGLPAFPPIAAQKAASLISPPARNVANGPGQPRGPPAGH